MTNAQKAGLKAVGLMWAIVGGAFAVIALFILIASHSAVAGIAVLLAAFVAAVSILAYSIGKHEHDMRAC